MLPQSSEERLEAQVEFVRVWHEHDVENGVGYALVSTSLEHKRHNAARDLRWQFVFGSAVIRLDKEAGRRIRWHAHHCAAERVIHFDFRRSHLGKLFGR
ncbi:hypothetical protein Mal4_22300 [Maioricimonas rarisocia]|uniref:Uncharacterized protein n=1 Tax=Maioricimonas rarisocia TaxID=2528026 RepID=A0A517Z668_9PLAN|nr:hypothetical protein Mal4_22300 [Maioricimonas rarisocia]